MEKTVIISGVPVRFKATGGIGYRYKAQFGREYLVDAMALEDFAASAHTVKRGGKERTEYDYTKLNLELLYNLLWTLAKTADETIPPPMEWLDSFDAFPVMDIYAQVRDILETNLKVENRGKNG